MARDNAEYGRQWRAANPDKVKANRKAYYAKHREEIIQYSTEYNKSHPEKVKRQWLKQYGITLEQYDKLLLQQEGKCACCKSEDPKGPWKRFAVDHNHVTGEIRGLLCFSCNTGIGMLGDSLEGLQQAINYLERRK